MAFLGLWYWTGDINAAIRRALDMGAGTMVLKAAYHDPASTGPLRYRPDFEANARRCREAGLLVAAEVFSLPRTCRDEGRLLRRAVLEGGATSAVLNAETPHEGDSGDGVRRFLDAFGGAQPLHAATDFRGGRLELPYHAALAAVVVSWHPMVYPAAFYPARPYGWVQVAFDDVMKPFRAWRSPGAARPVYPVLQSYTVEGRAIDYHDAWGQVGCALAWGTAGWSVYAAHDLPPRALLGFRDAARLTQRSRPPGLDEVRRIAEAAAAGARAGVLSVFS